MICAFCFMKFCRNAFCPQPSRKGDPFVMKAVKLCYSHINVRKML